MSADYTIHIDGASTPQAGRQGPAAAAIFVRRAGHFYHQDGRYMNCTVSEAELMALYMAVKWAVDNTNDSDNIQIFSDSKYVVHCFAKKAQLEYLDHWATATYPELFHDILKLWADDRMRINWIPREENKDADKLAQSTKRKRGY